MRFIRFIKETTFVVTRKEKTVISMPTVVFFGVGYFFDGAQGTEKPNRFLEKAGDFAEDARSEFTKDDPGAAGSEEI